MQSFESACISSEVVSIVLWKEIKQSDPIPLIRWNLNLKNLHYIGNDTQIIRNVKNAVVLSLRGNRFIMPLQLDGPRPKPKVNSSDFKTSADVNSVLRLQAYIRSIKDTKNRLMGYWQHLDLMMQTMSNNSRIEQLGQRIAQFNSKLMTSRKALKYQMETLIQKKNKLNEIESNLCSLRLNKNEVNLNYHEQRFAKNHDRHKRLCELIKRRQIELMVSLADIMNISKNTIGWVSVGNGVRNSRERLSTAYGNVVLLLTTAAKILHVAYPFELNYHPAYSSISPHSGGDGLLDINLPLYNIAQSEKFNQALEYLIKDIIHLSHCAGQNSIPETPFRSIASLMDKYKSLIQQEPKKWADSVQYYSYDGYDSTEFSLGTPPPIIKMKKSKSCPNIHLDNCFFKRWESEDCFKNWL